MIYFFAFSFTLSLGFLVYKIQILTGKIASLEEEIESIKQIVGTRTSFREAIRKLKKQK